MDFYVCESLKGTLKVRKYGDTRHGKSAIRADVMIQMWGKNLSTKCRVLTEEDRKMGCCQVTDVQVESMDRVRKIKTQDHSIK